MCKHASVTWNGSELREARLRRGWSQEDLARAAGLSVSNVSRWERDLHVPGGRMVQRLAGALEVPASSFFAGAELAVDEDVMRAAADLIRLLKKAAA